LGHTVVSFEGVFTGTVRGDGDSSATVTVSLSHRDNSISGQVSIGAGLKIDLGGGCRMEDVDLRLIPLSGSADPSNPVHFRTTAKVTESPVNTPGYKSVDMNATFDAVISSDTKTMMAVVTLEPLLAYGGLLPKINPKTLGCKPKQLRVSLAKQTPSGTIQGLGQSPPLPNLNLWANLISFRPPVGIQTNIRGRGLPLVGKWNFHHIEDGIGPVNLDYYAVKVSSLPRLTGVLATPDQLLNHIRLNINSFVDPKLTQFAPYDQKEELIWKSSNPLGAVLHLDFRNLFGGISVNVDDGSVVVGDFKSNYWIVSTIWTGKDGAHPLSGNREWGYFRSNGDYVFYTRAVDRMTPPFPLSQTSQVYAAQRQFWTGFQQLIYGFVLLNGGKAQILAPIDNRYDWNQVAALYHKPKVPWV
jgi:hypothetical protein